MNNAIKGADGKARCRWSMAAPEFLAYHDQEWGQTVANDQQMFEKLCLECFQSGLSWRTILAKRDNFRRAFHHFDIASIARYTEQDMTRLLQDEGIVRHRGKIAAVINNARCALALIEKEGSLAAFVWRYAPPPGALHTPQSASTSSESIAMAKELKKRGWQFIGPTTAYAFMQAMGLINDHALDCAFRAETEEARLRCMAQLGLAPA